MTNTAYSLPDLQSDLAPVFGSAKQAKRHLRVIRDRYAFVDFADARVLDVGGGVGTISAYAMTQGAREAVCLDPGGDGALQDHDATLGRARSALEHAGVRFVAATFQDFENDGEPFDIVILSNSVNHLDEDACIRLEGSRDAQRTYTDLFRKLADLITPTGRALISDVSPINFFPIIAVRNPIITIRNPFAPSIEWDKHHTPELWAKYLRFAGFADITTRWIPPPRLGAIGRRLLSNGPGAFFTSGYFLLDARRGERD